MAQQRLCFGSRRRGAKIRKPLTCVSSRMSFSKPFRSSRRPSRVAAVRFALVAALHVASTPFAAYAHGGLHEQIQQLTERIAKDPRDVQLYLRRGELHRLHEDWLAALADFEHGRALDPQRAEIDLHVGRTLVEAGHPASGLAALDRYLHDHPADGRALTVRAHALRALKRHLEAAQAFAAAADALEQADPQLYLDSANEYLAAGDARRDAALAVLDRGIRRVGPVVSLELPAIELELAAGRYDNALERIDRLAAQTSRKEHWLARRGEVLESCGRLDEARLAFESAQRAIDSLPAARRRVAATQKLEQRIAAALERLRTRTVEPDADGKK
ncbi:MAG: hypothetical protein D6744_03500 [Planctomycetota bacterium]|nr:MAG: hypothetical protein D6744_03500 [Planctomycetota bacterium]